MDGLLDVGTARRGKSAKRPTALCFTEALGTAPLHPEMRQRRRLPGFIDKAVSSVGDATLRHIAEAWDMQAGTTRVITVGTMCSGSELYMLSLTPLASALSGATGCEVSFEHVWACEKKLAKRKWIYDNVRPKKIFCDAMDLSGGPALDSISGRLVPVDAVDLLIAGFSCKDASRLNIHHYDRLDAVDAGAHSTGSTFQGFTRLLKNMNPAARLCLLENVPGLRDKQPGTGRSNFDAVREAFESMGFIFAAEVFDAVDTGMPNKRKRLYMVAVGGLAPDDAARYRAGLQQRVRAALSAILQGSATRPLDDCLLDEYDPQEMIKDWMPEAHETLLNHGRASQYRKGEGNYKWRRASESLWAACPHKLDKEKYLADFASNPWFHILSQRQQDLLLLQLCKHPFPGPQDGVVTLQTSATFAQHVTGALPTQVPNGEFWFLHRRRLQTGAEGLMLQGVDLVDIPALGPGSHSSRFLQDLAGNAFCVYQFVAWLLACLPEATYHH